MRALKEFLPPAPAKLVDIGGGPGRYSIELARQGYRVTLVDLSESNLALARQKVTEAGVALDGFIHANALDLSSLPSETFNAAILMGPLYHLLTADERHRALCETRRLLRPGGKVFAAFITRFAPFRDAAQKNQDWVHKDPAYAEHLMKTGVHNNGDGFTDAYFAHPDEVTPLAEGAGFTSLRLMSCEGVVASCEDYINTLTGKDWEIWADFNYQFSQDPSLLGASAHLLYIGCKDSMVDPRNE
jgi:ubiquinone/menaquinone biosynthesis C-methylase UbiE